MLMKSCGQQTENSSPGSWLAEVSICRIDHMVHSTIYSKVLNTLIFSMYHSLHVFYDHLLCRKHPKFSKKTTLNPHHV